MEETLLTKKDDDFEIVSSGPDGIIVRTNLDIGTEIKEEAPDAEGVQPRHYPVTIRNVRFICLTIICICFFFMFYSFVPFRLLISANRAAPAILLGCGWGLALISFIVMYAFREDSEVALAALISWILTAYVAGFSLAALLRSLAPFQASLICCFEFFAVLMYSMHSPRRMHHWNAWVMMMCVGMFVWLLNLLIFLWERDWISATIVFLFCVFVVPSYTAAEIYLTCTMRAEGEMKSIIYFLTDPIFVPIRWLKVKCSSNPPNAAFVLAGEISDD